MLQIRKWNFLSGSSQLTSQAETEWIRKMGQSTNEKQSFYIYWSKKLKRSNLTVNQTEVAFLLHQAANHTDNDIKHLSSLKVNNGIRTVCEDNISISKSKWLNARL